MKKTVLLIIAIAVFSCCAPSVFSQGVQINKLDDRVRIEINGKLFTEYWFKGDQHPAIIESKTSDGKASKKTIPTKHVYYYPIIGPGGVKMTRNWPMVPNAPDEEYDHPHHRSLWFSHGSVNGIDFWSETDKAGKIIHDDFLEITSGKEFGLI
ncbi:MAG TPA: PmoA family protein, partial [Verrucomicrobiota bacterium]|nr:PmoA family protein [Verrucomicrobiota bacterium]